MRGGMNISANNIFSNASGAMSRTRSDYGGSESNMRALSKKDAASSVQMAKDELQYEFIGDFEEQMKDFRDDDWE